MELRDKMLKKTHRSTLIGNASVYAISSVINSGITVLLLPMLTRFLTIEQYGILSMINATISIATPFVGMSISAAIQRQIVETDSNASRKYVFNAFVVMLFSMILVICVFTLFSNYISKYTEIPEEYLWMIVAISAMDTIINVALTILQFKEKVAVYALYRNLESLSNVLLSMIFVISLGMMLRGRIIAIVISKFICAFWGIVIIKKMVGFQVKIDMQKIEDILFNFGIPMIPTLLKSTILTYLDRIFITNMENISETGIYTVGNQLSLPILFIAQAFNLAYVPWLYNKLEKNKLEDKKLIVKLTYAYFVIITLIAFTWTIIVNVAAKYIIGIEYSSANMYVFWLALAYAFNGMHMMVVNYIYYEKKLKIYNVVTITVIFSNVILNYIFINQSGAIGAAQATLLVNIISFILTWKLASKVHHMPWNLKEC